MVSFVVGATVTIIWLNMLVFVIEIGFYLFMSGSSQNPCFTYVKMKRSLPVKVKFNLSN